MRKNSRSAASFLRSAGFRALVYQVLIVGSVLGTGYVLGRRAVERLGELGIKSGFGFLDNRAGFNIGERVPIPVLEEGLLYFLATVFGAILGVWLMSRWAASKGRTVAGDVRLAVLSVCLLFGVPGIVLYATSDTIQTEHFTADSTFRDALIIGIFNTIRVCVIAIALSTLVGLVVALMRLSPNWVLRALGRGYVECVRNIPFLLHLFFWYFGVLRSLPTVRNSVSIADIVFINNRGVYLPDPVPQPGLGLFCAAMLLTFILIYFLVRHARRIHEQRVRRIPVFWYSAALLVALLGAAVWTTGPPVSFTYPVLKGFNFRNAMVLTPELATLMVAMTVYHGAYAAEVIRSGIQSVDRGQIKAAHSLGLRRRHIFRFVVLPQSIRVIIPPMISRYLGLIKSSSLGVAVGYPEIVSIGRSIEYATGQAIEVVILTMAFYLILALTISIWMNWYNARVQLVTGR